MSNRISCLLAGVLFIAGIAAAGADDAVPATTSVVVELFTSQGCSSCPPADAFLGELAQRPGLVALAFHVDYWDYIGWKDPFASPGATKRQRDYGRALGLRTVYTPQMVIDGSIDAVGSHRSEVERAIDMARNRAKLPVAIERDEAGSWWVTLPESEADQAVPATVWLALFDRQQITQVKRGENAGATLTNFNIVRELRRLGEWRGPAVNLPLDIGAAELAGRGCAVIVQGGDAGPVLGVALMPTPDGGT